MFRAQGLGIRIKGFRKINFFLGPRVLGVLEVLKLVT